MILSELIKSLDVTLLQGSLDREIGNVIYDSRKVQAGDLFVCISGAVSDGHRYIPDVIAAGAAAVVAEKGHALPDIPETCTVLAVPDTRLALALLSAAYFGHPSEKLPVIGITGTKGKTTTTYMVKSVLEHAGYKVGLIGTIETIIGSRHIPSVNTTPESYVVQRDLRDMVDAGMDCAVMEVSSQALKLDRTAGILFEIGVFTNIEPDHIGPNEHPDFADYLACKSRLFRQCRHGIFNADDPHLDRILEGHTCTVETYGIDNPKADLRAVDIEHVHKPGYLGVHFETAGTAAFPVDLDIPGKFSVYNALCAICICRHFGVKTKDMQAALRDVRVRGRIEMVKVSDSFTLMIDYAHNAMALESLLTTLRDYHPKRLVCLFGCGGNRSRSRRFEMGEVSGRLADLTIITSDNPRYEKPEDIIADIVTGISRTNGKYVEIPDRREAIAWAIHNGRPGDIIVLAGKGHEDYQEICGKKYPMDEREIIADILKQDAVR